jgi:hypothetical protein
MPHRRPHPHRRPNFKSRFSLATKTGGKQFFCKSSHYGFQYSFSLASAKILTQKRLLFCEMYQRGHLRNNYSQYTKHWGVFDCDTWLQSVIVLRCCSTKPQQAGVFPFICIVTAGFSEKSVICFQLLNFVFSVEKQILFTRVYAYR